MWFSNKKEDNYYKFKSLNTYAWDSAMNNVRKFRKVFDKNELNYLSTSLEFYNKLFDEKDWDTEITLAAYGFDGDKKTNELCSKKYKIKVLKSENTVTTEFGWGADKYGEYWSIGDYIWEAHINNELVGTTKFRIEDAGKVISMNNPYFHVVSLKTFESQKEIVEDKNRVYLKQFENKNTRYISSELKFINKISREWLCEIFFNFYDDTGKLIGMSDTLSFITPNAKIKNEEFTITGGWGNANGNTWIQDNYRVDVVFMDTVVAMIPFSVGEKSIERQSEADALINEEILEFYDSSIVDDFNPDTINYSPSEKVIQETIKTISEIEEDNDIEIENISLDEILIKLDKLVGLDKIKNKIKEYIDYTKYIQLREERGIEENDKINLHSVFTGNPGTGKTTVVKLLGEIYRAIGLLSKGHVLTVESNDLISGYVRQTGESTKKLIEKARGGILFIDEAYMLYKDGSPNDFGPEAIAALITEMSDGKGDIAIMVAGYPKEMESFINSNPGLKSRFRNHYHFNDYTPNELVEIAKYAAKQKEVIFSKDALIKLKKIITDAFRKRDKTFGNARLAHSMVDEAKMNLGIRLIREYEPDKITEKLISVIQKQDIKSLVKDNLSQKLKLEIDVALLDEALNELNSLIGLVQIKQEIQELIRLTKYYNEIGRDVLKVFSMHTVFLGNPGTGKTTVARIIGKVYKALGLLERGHLVEADGGDLIAGFVGQTSIKTSALINKAMGGILFIDEAYAITEGGSNNGSNNFGKKAIATLIKEMEDHRGEFSVIVAGYTDNMKRFLETNPGMKSRFDKTFHFVDFTESELWEITESMFLKKGLKVNKKAEKQLKIYIAQLYKQRNKFFGNARSMRKIVEKSYRNQELRMASLNKTKRTKKIIETLVLEDVLEFDPSKIEVSKRKSVGFR